VHRRGGRLDARGEGAIDVGVECAQRDESGRGADPDDQEGDWS
jgi:hypothetical protein